MGDAEAGPVRLSFNPQLRVEFRGATVTSDAGLCYPRVGRAPRPTPGAALQDRGRLIRHVRYFILQRAESYLTQRLVRQILGRIERLAWHPT